MDASNSVGVGRDCGSLMVLLEEVGVLLTGTDTGTDTTFIPFAGSEPKPSKMYSACCNATFSALGLILLVSVLVFVNLFVKLLPVSVDVGAGGGVRVGAEVKVLLICLVLFKSNSCNQKGNVLYSHRFYYSRLEY